MDANNTMIVNGRSIPVKGNEWLISECDSITKTEYHKASDLICGADNYDPKESAICVYNTKTKEVVYSETLRTKKEFDARMKEMEDNGIKIIKDY
jgi:hypothetical protein